MKTTTAIATTTTTAPPPASTTITSLTTSTTVTTATTATTAKLFSSTTNVQKDSLSLVALCHQTHFQLRETILGMSKRSRTRQGQQREGVTSTCEAIRIKDLFMMTSLTFARSRWIWQTSLSTALSIFIIPSQQHQEKKSEVYLPETSGWVLSMKPKRNWIILQKKIHGVLTLEVAATM